MTEFVGYGEETEHGNIVTKSERVISFRSKNGSLTSALYKCMNAVMMALQNDITKRYDSIENVEALLGNSHYDIELPLSKFCQYMEWKSNNLTKAKKAISLLKNLHIEWGVSETQDGKGNRLAGEEVGFQQYVTRAEVLNGMLTIRLDADVRRELLNHEGLKSLAVNLRIANGAWSDKYTPRLYELALFASSENKRRFFYTVEKFRELMNVSYTYENGEKKWSHEKFKDFNKRVISPAVKNINSADFVDFTITPQFVGKPIREIVFFIREKEDLNELNEVHELKEDVIDLLEDLGLLNVTRNLLNEENKDPSYFEDKLSLKDLHYINYNIGIYEQYGKGKDNPSLYFKKMLLNNVENFESKWKIIEKEEKERLKQEKTRLKAAQAKQNEDLDRVEVYIIKEYRCKIVDQYLQKLTEKELVELEEACKKHQLKNNPSSSYLYDNLPTKALEANLREFVIKHYAPEIYVKSEVDKLVKKAQKVFLDNPDIDLERLSDFS